MRITQDEKRAKVLRGMIAGLGSTKTPTTPRYTYTAPAASITEVDLLRVKREIMDEIAKKESEENNDDIVAAVVKKIKEGKSLDVSDLRNYQSFIWGGKKYGTHELMHGGSAATSGMNVYSEVVAGSGTTFTLAHTPVSGTLQLYGNGQRLTSGAGNDYTLSGKTLTMANSFTAGTILADYLY